MQEVFLPEYAPQEWQDREKLWNAVEKVETAKDSRLAREFVVALPIELSREQQIELLQDFIREQFVADGMCAELVQEIRSKSKERKSLLAEKKETPFYLIPKQHELSSRIAELTEDLEELKSEKDMLLHSLECSDDAGIAAVKKDISTMEAALEKLAQQEEKYTTELNDALQQYAELKSQAAEFDPDELQDARLALRPAMERSAVDRVQSAYGNKYDPLIMYDSKRDVADLLKEEAKVHSVRDFLRKQHKLHGHEQQRKTKHDRER